MSGRVALGANAVAAALLVGAAVVAWGSDTRTSQVVTPASGSGALDGRQVFLTKGCVGCHDGPGVQSLVDVGPDLNGLAARAGTRRPGMAADTYVIESITNPSAFLVPNFGARMPTLPVNTAELHALVAYLLHAP